MKSDTPLRAYLIMFIMPLFYSSNLVLGRAAVGEVEPITLAFFRWLLAMLILAPFALASSRDLLTALWKERRMLVALGFLGMVLCGAGVYVSLQFTTATNGTLIYTTSPALIILIEWIVFGRKVSIGQILGVVLAITGIFAIVVQGSLDRLLALTFNLGDLGIAVAALSWAIYSVILRREKLAELPVIVSFFGIAVCAVLLLAPLTVAEIALTGAFPTKASAWWTILALAIVPSVLAFSAFQYGVKVLGPSVAALFMYLLPAYGVFLSVVFLGERFELYHAAGMAAIMGGIILATLPTPRKRTKAPI